MKKKILLIIIAIITLVGVGGTIFIITQKKEKEKNYEPVYRQYGTTCGNRYDACQGEKGLYYSADTEIYKLDENQNICYMGVDGHYMNYHDGYVYFVLDEKEKYGGIYRYSKLVKMDEDTGEQEIVVSAGDLVDGDYEKAGFDNVELVDGEIKFNVDYKTEDDETFSIGYKYICSDGRIEELGKENYFRNYDFSAYEPYLTGTLLKPYWGHVLPHDHYTELQYAQDYVYGMVLREQSEDRKECGFAPTKFCMMEAEKTIGRYSVEEEELVHVDDDVTAFNVGENCVYYAKADSGNTCTVWQMNLDGSGKKKVAEMSTTQWIFYIIAGKDSLIVKAMDWEKNRKLKFGDRVYDVYTIDVDTGTVTCVTDIFEK